MYNETKVHGTFDFPIGFYHVDKNHPRYEMATHWHTYIEIIRVISGKLFVKLDNREYTVYPGQIIFINPETVHGAFPSDCVYECSVFSAYLLPRIFENGFSFLDSLTKGAVYVDEMITENEKTLHSLINEFFDLLAIDEASAKYLVFSTLCRIYSHITKEKKYHHISGSGKSKSVENLKEVLRYIRENYGENITLEKMASKVNMSPKYFCSFFKAMTNKTPIDYLISYRIERAAHFLTTTDTSVTDIAFDCGFNDLSYFIKTFKNIYDFPPREYRKLFYTPL